MNEKIRILFVDDEVMILQGLKRMLRNQRSECDMSFVDSGESALKHLAECPADVIVSDMRMPGMNGAELLNKVMKAYPESVRFILSGHSDQDLILKCVGSTHQYLAKPCEPEHLKAAIARSMRLRRTLKDEALISLISKIDKLPSLPSVYMELVEKLQSPDAELEEIAAVISKDIGMTAKVLKLVNSAFFGLGQEISTVYDAVTYLGFDTLKTLVLVVDVFAKQEVDLANKAPVSLDSILDHSMQVARVASLICKAECIERVIAEQAFLASMLHDIGKYLLASNFSGIYNQLIQDARDSKNPCLCQFEQKYIGGSHDDVAGYLFGLWGLPTPIIEAVACHHSPSVAEDEAFSPLTAVHVADVLVNEMENPKVFRAIQLDEAYLSSIGLLERTEHWRAVVAEYAAAN